LGEEVERESEKEEMGGIKECIIRIGTFTGGDTWVGGETYTCWKVNSGVLDFGFESFVLGGGMKCLFVVMKMREGI